MRRSNPNLQGLVFGKWTAIEEGPRTSCNHKQYLCKCECGKFGVIRESYLLKGKSTKCRTCGNKGNSTTHGYRKHKLYRVWASMKDRCQREKSGRYYRYGARGIKVCDEWNNNAGIFIDWCLVNGWKQGLQLDRINNDGNYEPSNCRFVTPLVNNLNKSNTISTYENAKMVKFLIKGGYKNKRLAEIFNCSEATITRLKHIDLNSFINKEK